MDEEKLFGGLPKSLRQEVCNHMYLDLLTSVPLFKNCDEVFKANLARVMRMITVQEEFYVFRQGDDGQEMYFVRSGCVDIVLGDGRVIVKLKAGSFFGEIALFEVRYCISIVMGPIAH
jgi:CRP-like cAMP-binding protein